MDQINTRKFNQKKETYSKFAMRCGQVFTASGYDTFPYQSMGNQPMGSPDSSEDLQRALGTGGAVPVTGESCTESHGGDLSGQRKAETSTALARALSDVFDTSMAHIRADRNRDASAHPFLVAGHPCLVAIVSNRGPLHRRWSLCREATPSSMAL